MAPLASTASASAALRRDEALPAGSGERCRLPLAAVARLESLEDDLQQVAQMVGIVASHLASGERVRLHARADGGVATAAYSEALLARPVTACLLMCELLATDYDCLGYPRPVACHKCWLAGS